MIASLLKDLYILFFFMAIELAGKISMFSKLNEKNTFQG